MLTIEDRWSPQWAPRRSAWREGIVHYEDCRIGRVRKERVEIGCVREVQMSDVPRAQFRWFATGDEASIRAFARDANHQEVSIRERRKHALSHLGPAGDWKWSSAWVECTGLNLSGELEDCIARDSRLLSAMDAHRGMLAWLCLEIIWPEDQGGIYMSSDFVRRLSGLDASIEIVVDEKEVVPELDLEGFELVPPRMIEVEMERILADEYGIDGVKVAFAHTRPQLACTPEVPYAARGPAFAKAVKVAATKFLRGDRGE